MDTLLEDVDGDTPPAGFAEWLGALARAAEAASVTPEQEREELTRAHLRNGVPQSTLDAWEAAKIIVTRQSARRRSHPVTTQRGPSRERRPRVRSGASTASGSRDGPPRLGGDDLPPRPCRGCGDPFTPTNSRQRYHDELCRGRTRVNRHRHPETAHPWEPPHLTKEIDDAIAMTSSPEDALFVVLARQALEQVAA